MKETERKRLKALVRTMYDYQDLRIRTAGRLRLKADDTPQDDTNMAEPIFSESDYKIIEYVKEDSENLEKMLAKDIEKIVKADPLWDAFFDGVKGCGILMSAAIMAEVDIEKATTVSKLWQYAGLNPGLVRGKKRVQKGKEYEIVVTDTMVRGDRKTPGFVAPYNSWLRTKLCGVLADCFIRAKSSYALDYYYPYKQRLEHEERKVEGGEKSWKDETKGHRDNAARRYMIKMFLKDLYVVWRTVEGLPVRAPYQEEYLGHTHEKTA